jgi:acetyltransferase
MSVRGLDRIFRPRSVAVIGASPRSGQVGHIVVRNLLAGGFPGAVYPVNPKYDRVLDLPAYAAIGQTPEPADLAIVCTPAATVPGIVSQCGAAGVMGLIVLSAGFRETGAAGRGLEAEVLAAARRFPGLRIVGPNCLGAIVPGARLNASFAADMPPLGRVAFVSQSGALCTAVLDWALREQVGFSHFVSIGNALDVSLGDLIDYLANDPETASLLLYIESVSDARGFMSAARAFTRTKPLVAYKAGRFAASAQAAASHTGALAGVDAVYDAALRRAGIVRVEDMESLFDCAELLSRQRTPRGGRLAIVTNAGGPGVMAVDALLERQGQLADLAKETIARLDRMLPPAWSHGNPVDVLGDAPPDRLAGALQVVLLDPAVDAALAILTPQAMTDPTGTAEAVASAARETSKPVLAAWMGGQQMQPGMEALNRAHVPTYSTPEQAIRAFLHLVTYARHREVLHETPRDIPLHFAPDRSSVSRLFAAARQSGRDLLTEDESKELLSAYGIPVTLPHPARTADEAAAEAEGMGFPVVLKLWSPDITHKTDVGGVVLNVTSAAAVREAYVQVVAAARRHRPDARVEGVTVQRMVTAPVAFELILGARKDPAFGSTILVGLGGIATEVFHDRALELPPLNERLARRMIESLRSWPLLAGYRGRPGVDVDRLIETLLRFSFLVADCPQIAEVDVNPLLATPQETIALDARVILDRTATGDALLPYSHLAIRPYPHEWERNVRLTDGTEVLLRPIRPEDEPLWLDLLASCSAQSLWFRFRYLFKEAGHEMAARFCFIDYDREMALVAERVEEGRRRLIGIGRIVANDERTSAEFAALVADRWQGNGLGKVLLDGCLEVARRAGIARVCGETTPDNVRMLGLFRSRGFALNFSDPHTVLAEKRL